MQDININTTEHNRFGFSQFVFIQSITLDTLRGVFCVIEGWM